MSKSKNGITYEEAHNTLVATILTKAKSHLGRNLSWAEIGYLSGKHTKFARVEQFEFGYATLATDELASNGHEVIISNLLKLEKWG